MRHPPPLRHRRQGGDGRAVPAVLEAGEHHDRPLSDSASFLSRFSPDPEGPWIGPDWYTAAALLQLAERAGGFAEGPVVLPPQRGRSLRRGDVDPRRRSRAHGLSPAHRGGMGIRLPGRYGHQPVLRSLDRPARTLMLGIKPTARSMPGRAGACCRTTWACSTCWETCLNGVRTVRMLPNQERRECIMIYKHI